MTTAKRKAAAALYQAKFLMDWGVDDKPCRICECRVSHKTSRGYFLCFWHWEEPIQLELAR